MPLQLPAIGRSTLPFPLSSAMPVSRWFCGGRRELQERLGQHQMFALMAASDDQGASFGAVMRFLFYTGSRLSEALALRWGDVDLDKGLVRLR